MLIFRWILVILLLVAGGSFIFFAATGQMRYFQFGRMVLKWTVIAALAFFAVLAAERIL